MPSKKKRTTLPTVAAATNRTGSGRLNNFEWRVLCDCVKDLVEPGNGFAFNELLVFISRLIGLYRYAYDEKIWINYCIRAY